MADLVPFSTASLDVRLNPYLATGTGALLCPDCGQLVHTLRNLGDRWVCVVCYQGKQMREANT